MVKIFAIPRKSLRFSGQWLGWEVLGDQWNDIASHKSYKSCTVSGRLRPAASLIVLGGVGGELKNWMVEQPIKTKGCTNILFLLRENFIDS